MTCMQAFFAVQASSAAPGTLVSLLTLSAGCAGFDVADAIALLRLDDLYVEVFEVKDVKVRSLVFVVFGTEAVKLSFEWSLSHNGSGATVCLVFCRR